MSSSALPLIILVVLVVGLVVFNRRNRDRAERTNALRLERLRPGTRVMTTSGLYGTIVSIDRADDTALLAIAPGVEVTWTVAALREPNEVPPRYRRPEQPGPDETPPDSGR